MYVLSQLLSSDFICETSLFQNKMGDCHLDDLLDMLDQDDDFEENVTTGEVQPQEQQNDKDGHAKSNENERPPETDPEKEALKRKLQEMEEQMKMIKSQIGTGQTPVVSAIKTVTEVDIFSSNSEVDTVENRHLRSPVKVSESHHMTLIEILMIYILLACRQIP